MYAIIKTGGKQIKVFPKQSIFVEKLNANVEDEFVFDEVLAVFDGKKIHIGKPTLNAKVKGKIEKQGKQKKVMVFKTKAKSNWAKKNGHRQPYTRVLINEIILNENTNSSKSLDAKKS